MDEIKNNLKKPAHKKRSKILLIIFLVLAIPSILFHVDQIIFFFPWIGQNSQKHDFLINFSLWAIVPIVISSVLIIFFYLKIKSDKKRFVSMLIIFIITLFPFFLASSYLIALYHGAYNAKTYWQKVEKSDCYATGYVCPPGYEDTYPPPCTEKKVYDPELEYNSDYDPEFSNDADLWGIWEGACVNAHDCTCKKL